MIDEQKMSDDYDVLNHSIEHKPKFSPEQLLEKMGYDSYRFESAVNFLTKYSAQVEKEANLIRTKILSRRFDLLKSSGLKQHLELIFQNEKYKPTKEDLEGFVNLELGKISDQLNRALVILKNAEKSHDMWAKQLSYYQSLLRKETAELSSLNMVK